MHLARNTHFLIGILLLATLAGRPAMADVDPSSNPDSQETYQKKLDDAKAAIAAKKQQCIAEGDSSEACTHEEAANGKLKQLLRACVFIGCAWHAEEIPESPMPEPKGIETTEPVAGS